MSSRISIRLDNQLEPADYARLVHLVWGVLVLGGQADHASIEIDSTATIGQMQAELDTFIETWIRRNPFGW